MSFLLEGQFSDADEDSIGARHPHREYPFIEEENWDECPPHETNGQKEEIISQDSGCNDDTVDYLAPEEIGGLTNKLNDYRHGRPRCNANIPSSSTMQPKSKVLQKYNSKIVVDKMFGLKNFAGSVTNQLDQHQKGEHNKITHRDKSDRATIDQVFDKRTISDLQKTMRRYDIDKVNGCISTGKEAQVYHAIDKFNNEYAIKVYKTSCMTFKNREKYIAGNHNCRYGYGKSKNSRKMVQTWAEKEFRNLRMLKKTEGIYSPHVTDLVGNVLMMEFIGKDGNPAPKLKDVELTIDRACEVYLELIIAVRKMYRDCKFVHADLSEYNILYYNDSPYIIDVSQSVGPEHGSAFEFLKSDLTNITKFFHKKGVLTVPLSELFYFVVSDKLHNIDDYLNKIEARTKNSINSDSGLDEDVFRHLYIPRCLNEVNTFEIDFNDLKTGKKTITDLPYVQVLGLEVNNLCVKEKEEIIPEDPTMESIESFSETDESEEDQKFTPEELKALKDLRRPPGRPKNETEEERKERKSACKDEARDKRKNKLKKKDKKQLIKKTKRH